MPKLVITSIIVLTLLAGGYFLVQKNFNKIQTLTSEKLILAENDQPYLALVFIASQKGFFKDENLDVTLKNFPSGKDALADALAGNSDIATVGESPVVNQVNQGQNVAIITSLYTSTKNTALIARRDSDINRTADFKGKRIAVTKGTTGEFFLFSYLVSQGIQLSDVLLVDANAKDMKNLLKQDKVDAVVVLNPDFYEIRKAFPSDFISIFQSDVYTNTSVLAGRQDKIVAKKEALVRLLRALVKAQKLVESNREEAIRLVVNALPNVSEESIRGSWDEFTPGLGLNNVLLTVLTNEANWFYKNGVYPNQPPDFRKFLFTNYLKEVDPKTVTVY